MRRSAESFVQVVNLLNFEYEGGEGLQLAVKVLSTLAALLRGNEASRRRLVSDVGYDQILTAVKRQVGALCMLHLPCVHSPLRGNMYSCASVVWPGCDGCLAVQVLAAESLQSLLLALLELVLEVRCTHAKLQIASPVLA
jgi:hypothetical protein